MLLEESSKDRRAKMEGDTFSFVCKNRDGSMSGCLSWTREAQIEVTNSEVVAELIKDILKCLGTS